VCRRDARGVGPLTIYLPPGLLFAVGAVVVWTVVWTAAVRRVTVRRRLSSHEKLCFQVIAGPVVWAVALWDRWDQAKVRRSWVAGEVERERQREEERPWH
jgi:hypothetical protein